MIREMNDPAWPGVMEFGERAAERTYVQRPSAYAVLLDESGRIGVIENPRGTFLPGGGAVQGETPEATLQREVREECGYEVTQLEPLGEAVQLVYTAGNAHGLSKRGVFFRARLGRRLVKITESQASLVWLEPGQAASALTLASQAWVVERVVGGASLAAGERAP